jgi:septal ring factor EnvC (AmiA/AmiB activator)
MANHTQIDRLHRQLQDTTAEYDTANAERARAAHEQDALYGHLKDANEEVSRLKRAVKAADTARKRAATRAHSLYQKKQKLEAKMMSLHRGAGRRAWGGR